MSTSAAVPEPFFSIIVPVWNRATTIHRCLDSIFSQTFQDYEVVAVDDGSTDDSVALMQQVGDPRLRVVRHETNLGKNAARRTAVGNARGLWIMQLDSDDALLPGALETVARLARDAADDVGVVGMSFKYHEGGRTPDPPYPPGDVGFEQWLEWLDGSRGTDFLICRRREVCDDVLVPSDGRGSAQMMLRTAAKWKFRVSPEFGAIVYSDADNRLCAKKAELLSAQSKLMHAIMCEEILQEFGPALRQHAPRHYRNLLFSAGRWFLLAGQRGRGAKWMWRHLTSRPWSFRGWVTLVLGLIGPGAILGARRLLGKG